MYGKEALEAMEKQNMDDTFHYPDIPVTPEEDEAWEAYEAEPDPIVAKVIKRMSLRSQEGIEKYGCNMMRDDVTTTQWIDHAIEELLDGAIYLERLKYDLIHPRLVKGE